MCRMPAVRSRHEQLKPGACSRRRCRDEFVERVRDLQLPTQLQIIAIPWPVPFNLLSDVVHALKTALQCHIRQLSES